LILHGTAREVMATLGNMDGMKMTNEPDQSIVRVMKLDVIGMITGKEWDVDSVKFEYGTGACTITIDLLKSPHGDKVADLEKQLSHYILMDQSKTAAIKILNEKLAQIKKVAGD
jgi:hypothetical protein